MKDRNLCTCSIFPSALGFDARNTNKIAPNNHRDNYIYSFPALLSNRQWEANRQNLQTVDDECGLHHVAAASLPSTPEPPSSNDENNAATSSTPLSFSLDKGQISLVTGDRPCPKEPVARPLIIFYCIQRCIHFIVQMAIKIFEYPVCPSSLYPVIDKKAGKTMRCATAASSVVRTQRWYVRHYFLVSFGRGNLLLYSTVVCYTEY